MSTILAPALHASTTAASAAAGTESGGQAGIESDGEGAAPAGPANERTSGGAPDAAIA